MPLVSVIMSVFNSEPYVAETVDSMLRQTFTDFEFIILNDGSTDGTARVITGYDDLRIQWFDFSDNQGYVPRLNFGLQHARGKYIARMDSDDIALPERLARQVAFLEAHPEYGLCGTFIELMGEDRFPAFVTQTEDHALRIALLFNNPFAHPSVMLRADLLKRHGLTYLESYQPAEDYRMWVSISQHARIANLPEVLLRYRVHPHQISHYGNTTQMRHRDRILREQLVTLGIDPTEEEMQLHSALYYDRVPITPRYLPRLRRWLRKLATHNQAAGIYPEPAFKNYLDQLYRRKQELVRQRFAQLPLRKKVLFKLVSLADRVRGPQEGQA